MYVCVYIYIYIFLHTHTFPLRACKNSPKQPPTYFRGWGGGRIRQESRHQHHPVDRGAEAAEVLPGQRGRRRTVLLAVLLLLLLLLLLLVLVLVVLLLLLLIVLVVLLIHHLLLIIISLRTQRAVHAALRFAGCSRRSETFSGCTPSSKVQTSSSSSRQVFVYMIVVLCLHTHPRSFRTVRRLYISTRSKQYFHTF